MKRTELLLKNQGENAIKDTKVPGFFFLFPWSSLGLPWCLYFLCNIFVSKEEIVDDILNLIFRFILDSGSLNASINFELALWNH